MIKKLSTPDEILQSRDVMLQLRPQVPAEEYLGRVTGMMESEGYQLVGAFEGELLRAVAGYRIMNMLYCGRILYVDDLNTDERLRSRGFGKMLIDWLKEEGRSRGCGELHLDSGVQRESAHRFYFREGLTISAYHFRRVL